jgi:uncharacterized protein
MHIQLEAKDNNTIRSYSDTAITVGESIYESSVIIGSDAIIAPWSIHTVQELTDITLRPILELEPEIIIIGHQQPLSSVPMAIMQDLSKKRIGLEFMSIGAACRTFNVLLSEKRNVVVGIIFS